jgi:Mrr N-terminal domain
MFKIELSPATYQRLLKQARSFDDTPDAVISRLLDGAEKRSPAGLKHKLENKPILPPSEGELFPETKYWLPILQILADAGGASQSRAVIDKLEDQIGSQLKARDYDVLSMGEVRWRNRARFARLRMKEQGLISNQSPRGIWEITEEGRHYLNARPPE